MEFVKSPTKLKKIEKRLFISSGKKFGKLTWTNIKLLPRYLKYIPIQ